MGGRRAWRTLLVDGLLEAVCPRRCLVCGTPDVDADGPLCGGCRDAVAEALANAYCPRCGATLPPYGAVPGGCGRCVDVRLAYRRVLRVGAYRAGLQTALKAFKYGGREELDDYFVQFLARAIAGSDLYEAIDAITPVPTCWQHRLRRLFHPAEVLARGAAQRCGIPYAPVLVRRGGGPHQVGQTQTARLANVRGKFHLARGCAVRGSRICVVDDVMTTGATAGECARVLRRAGAAEVYVAVVARAETDPATLLHV